MFNRSPIATYIIKTDANVYFIFYFICFYYMSVFFHQIITEQNIKSELTFSSFANECELLGDWDISRSCAMNVFNGVCVRGLFSLPSLSGHHYTIIIKKYTNNNQKRV